MSIDKRLIVPERLRRPPAEGFSWVDRRFMRDHAPALGRDEILLYLFLAAVSDRHGLSYWGDAKTSARLKTEEGAIVCARDGLVRRDLLAYAAPLTQVLSLPEPRVQRTDSAAEQLGAVLRRLRRDAP